ncbi:MAG TPA: RES domain-containing protein [Acetobacteraceae bacterium]
MLTAFRIGDPEGAFPIFDANGSKLFPGRWNTAEAPIIYASEHYSTAMLEKLAGSNGELPPNQHYIDITIPNGLSYEMLDPARLPDWDHPSFRVARAFGEAWQRERRSALLLVPSVIARIELNILINPEHPAFPSITHGPHRPVWWDRRLFRALGSRRLPEHPRAGI